MSKNIVEAADANLTIRVKSKEEKQVDSLIYWVTKQISDLTEVRTKISGKFASDFLLSSFDLDAIVEAQEFCSVAHDVRGIMEGAADFEGATAVDVITAVNKYAMQRVLSYNASRSSSSASKQMAAATHDAWVTVAKMLHGNW